MQAIPDIRAVDAEGGATGWYAVAGVDFVGVSADSRRMQPGFLFAALPGTRADGRHFIADAVARGAAAVLAPEGTVWPPGVPARPLIHDGEPRRRLAQIAAALAGAQPATVVAVTGTNGKTSTVEFLRQIWTLAGYPAAGLGTLGLHAPGFAPGPGLTTPDPEALATTFAQLARAGVQHAAMEASSHGLDQFRLDGVRLTAAAFTNLTRDHLDYHVTMERYRAAKLRLFDTLLPAGAPALASTALDAASMAALRTIAARRRLDLRTVGEGGTMVRLLRATPRPDGQDLEIEAGGTRRSLFLPLPGRFQADNALLAAALAELTGVADGFACFDRLAGVRGRMELAARLTNGSAVYVDFAHTPDALERLLTALRPHTSGRLHVVFGAGGDRDPGKRPLMGAACSRLADVVVVTDDNPRSEDPAAIRAAVLAGCPGGRDGGGREAAIASALADLGPGDVLAVAGKGHEQGQTIGGVTLPFDDVETVRRLVGGATPPPNPFPPGEGVA
jgi:UDP-N-acetylmuramoyl-L-alanyl-D-glutamate--2,6-diaminopimelate ligase